MKLFRCLNEECGSEFESDAPACPECAGAVVVELVAVHYLVADAKGPIKTLLGNRMIACQPERKKLIQCTGERAAVSCPKCKETPVFTGHEVAGVDQHVPHAEQKLENEHGVKFVAQG